MRCDAFERKVGFLEVSGEGKYCITRGSAFKVANGERSRGCQFRSKSLGVEIMRNYNLVSPLLPQFEN